MFLTTPTRTYVKICFAIHAKALQQTEKICGTKTFSPHKAEISADSKVLNLEPIPSPLYPPPPGVLTLIHHQNSNLSFINIGNSEEARYKNFILYLHYEEAQYKNSILHRSLRYVPYILCLTKHLILSFE
jgi:hypothetical protein